MDLLGYLSSVVLGDQNGQSSLPVFCMDLRLHSLSVLSDLWLIERSACTALAIRVIMLRSNEIRLTLDCGGRPRTSDATSPS